MVAMNLTESARLYSCERNVKWGSVGMPKGWALYAGCFKEAFKLRGQALLAITLSVSIVTISAGVLFAISNSSHLAIVGSLPLLELIIFFITLVGGIVLLLFIYIFLDMAMLANATSVLRGRRGSAVQGIRITMQKSSTIFHSIRYFVAYLGGADFFFPSIILCEEFKGYRNARERSAILYPTLGKEVESAELFGSRMYWLSVLSILPAIWLVLSIGRELGLSETGIIGLLIVIIIILLWLMGMNLAAIQTLRARKYLEVTSMA
jgi:hypothetical protein